MYAHCVVRLPDHLRGAPLGEERIDSSVLAAHQRQRVLANVIPVLAKRGYQATKVDDLLAAGKIGVGNFYSLFEGKEDCFLAAFDWVVTGARERVSAAYRDAGSWAEGAVLGLSELISTLCAEPQAARIVLVEGQAAGPVAMARYESLLDEAAALLRSGRGRGATESDLPVRFEQTAVAGLAYYLQQRLLGTEPLEPAPLFAEVAPLVLEPIVGSTELRRQITNHPLATS
jgi:AcrR family transcriptional regulator